MARPRLAGLPITGAADLRAETGSGSTPRNGAGSMATETGGGAAGQDLGDQPAEGVPDQGRLVREFADHVAEVVGDLPDALVGEDFGVLVRVLDGGGVIGPARRQGGVACLLEHRPPAIPAGLQQPEPVDEHVRLALGGIGLLDLLCFVLGGVRHDVSYPFGAARNQPAARAAARMTRVTAPGLEIRDRCPASISVMWAWARWDMNSCSAGGITWSAVPISDQDGIVCQAGTPEGSDPALNAAGRWVAARMAAWLADRPLAKHWANPG